MTVALLTSSSFVLNHLCDLETDRRNLEWVRSGQGVKLSELTPEELQQSGDHEILNWIITLGIIGDKPANIVDVLETQTQLAYRVAAIWE